MRGILGVYLVNPSTPPSAGETIRVKDNKFELMATLDELHRTRLLLWRVQSHVGGTERRRIVKSEFMDSFTSPCEQQPSKDEMNQRLRKGFREQENFLFLVLENSTMITMVIFQVLLIGDSMGETPSNTFLSCFFLSICITSSTALERRQHFSSKIYLDHNVVNW